MEKGIGFLIVVFIAGFIIYLLAQIGTGKISFGEKFSFLTLTPPGGMRLSVPASAPSPSVQVQFQQPASQVGAQQPTPPTGFSASQLSPFYGMVKINQVRPSYGYADPSEFTLSSNYQNPETIDITGWRLASNKSMYAAIIPQGVANYSPTGPLYDGDIIIDSGTTVNVSSGISPIGKSFRLNGCTGYLNEMYKFSSSLPSNCPTSYDRSEITTFNGNCQSFILSQYGCHTPTPDEINRAAGYQDTACRAYLDRFSFNSCYRTHSTESNFFSHEWRVWLNLQTPLQFDSQHDRILLLDIKGLLVDQYVY
ncbi:MAG: hypothetical protein Q7R98_01910 [Candidatus Jorgensenbacteria bacterium]|nr:hypothetical protein [Candidatus Jorgensenbacteria bacterium]